MLINNISKRYDISGMDFGRLRAEIFRGKNKHNNNLWECQCLCGNKIVAVAADLRSGNTKSCGCLQKEKAKDELMKHTLTHGLSRDSDGKKIRLFRIWTGMKTRCYNSNNKAYPDYGGRDIKICDEWLDFKKFHDWAYGNGYDDKLSIERIETNGNYEPGNCTWTDSKAQANNRRSSRMIEFEGQIKSLSQWADYFGVKYSNAFERLKRGWSFEQTFEIKNKLLLEE